MSTPAAKRPCRAQAKAKAEAEAEALGTVTVTFALHAHMCSEGLVKPIDAGPRAYDRAHTSEGQLLHDAETAFLAANPGFFTKNPHVKAGVFLAMDDRDDHVFRLQPSTHHSESLFSPSTAPPASVFRFFLPLTTTAEVRIYIVDAKALLDAWCAANSIADMPPIADWTEFFGLTDVLRFADRLYASEPTIKWACPWWNMVDKLYHERPETLVVDQGSMMTAFLVLQLVQHNYSTATPMDYPKIDVLVRHTGTNELSRHQMTTDVLRKIKDPATTPAERNKILAKSKKGLNFALLALP